jgi:hypothetical protein
MVAACEDMSTTSNRVLNCMVGESFVETVSSFSASLPQDFYELTLKIQQINNAKRVDVINYYHATYFLTYHCNKRHCKA